jgi:hypothetical protein
VERFREVASIAGPLGCWEKLRSEILDALVTRKHFYTVCKIHLADGNVDAAIEIETRAAATGHSSGTALDVARAAERVRPRDALRLYAREVELLIEQGAKRSRYREACSLLTRMRDIHLATGDAPGWEKRIAELRWSYSARSALRDELAACGL